MTGEAIEHLQQIHTLKGVHCDHCKRVNIAKMGRDLELSNRRFLRWLRITHGIEFKEAGGTSGR